MSGAAITALVGLALAVVAVRRRSLATLLVSLQSLVLGAVALDLSEGHGGELALAAAVLFVRGVTIPALFAYTLRRTREPRPVAAAAPGATRLLIAAVAALAAAAVAPPLGIGDRAAEQGALAVVVLGMAIVVTRRPTLFQALGLLVAENGVYMLALSVPGGLPALIEVGVAFDLVLVLAVSAAFTFKIHRELGTGDTELLRDLRD